MLLSFDDDGPGPVVVLLHGFPLDRSMWSHQQASIGSIYRLIVPDLRGHGTTAAPDGIYSIDEMADDVIELLDALQLREPVVFGGLSMGGYVALSIAERFPERVRALMLINTRASADSEEAARLREEMATEVDRTGDIEPVIAKMLPRLFSRDTFQKHPELVAKLHGRMSRMTARAVAGTLRGMATRPDRSAFLPRIQVPTLVIAGAEDQIIPTEEAEGMARAVPGGRLATIPGAGHLAPIEKFQQVDREILDFLQGLW
jgi:3-oxoadipate enol-lactonase